MPEILERLAQLFSHFPGTGPRQAKRFAYHVATLSRSERQTLATLIEGLADMLMQCPSCGRFHSERTPECRICRDGARDKSLLMLVERDTDIDAVERAGAYRGYYLVLGGHVPLSGKSTVREEFVKARVVARAEDGLAEIILGLPATTEGDHTADAIRGLLAGALPESVRLSTFGRGFSTGTEVEYSDTETLRAALKNRA